MHPFAPFRPRRRGRSILENRKIGIEENCNVNEIWREFKQKFLAKRIRAHDGCLGIGRRRRTRKTATILGEPSTGFDPGVSEWGNPTAFAGRRRGMNKDSPAEPHQGK